MPTKPGGICAAASEPVGESWSRLWTIMVEKIGSPRAIAKRGRVPTMLTGLVIADGGTELVGQGMAINASVGITAPRGRVWAAASIWNGSVAVGSAACVPP